MSIELELPVWYIDDVQLDDLGSGAGAAYFEILNRNPEPDQIGIRCGSDLVFQLMTEAADAPVSGNVEVRITVGGTAEVTAILAGVFQVGWNGARSAITFPDADTAQIVIDPTTDFPSETLISIRVIATSTNAQAIDETYTFTSEDKTAPEVDLIVGRSKKVVRFTFNEPVSQEGGASGAASALNPANYLFTRTTVADDPNLLIPSVPILAESVEAASSTEFDVTIDWEMTPGKVYTGFATGIEDVLGTAIVAPNNQEQFLGFVPQIPEQRDFDAWKMIPKKNRDEDNGDGRRLVEVFKEICALALCLIDRWTDIIDPDLAPENFVDAMLCDLGNPFEFDLTLTEKRKLVLLLVPLYQQKGTEVGIVNAIRFFLGIEVTITVFAGEGWDLGLDELSEFGTEGTPPATLGPGTQFALYSFEIVSPVVLTQEQRDQIKEITDLMKPAHTHCVNLVEPVVPEVIDHLELGISALANDEWDLHE